MILGNEANIGLIYYGPKWSWAEMVMGRNGHGPKWLWAEMTRNPLRQSALSRLWNLGLSGYPSLGLLGNSTCQSVQVAALPLLSADYGTSGYPVIECPLLFTAFSVDQQPVGRTNGHKQLLYTISPNSISPNKQFNPQIRP